MTVQAEILNAAWWKHPASGRWVMSIYYREPMSGLVQESFVAQVWELQFWEDPE